MDTEQDGFSTVYQASKRRIDPMSRDQCQKVLDWPAGELATAEMSIGLVWLQQAPWDAGGDRPRYGSGCAANWLLASTLRRV